MEAHTIARRLVSLAAEGSRQIREQNFNARNELLERRERENLEEDDRYSSHAKQLLHELEMALAEADWQPQPRELEVAAGEEWSFGRREDLTTKPLKILRGYVQPVKSRPLLSNISLKVVCFLMSIEGSKDSLLRERSGEIGWHYHYLNAQGRRSDLVVCWDTRWKDSLPLGPTKGTRGLFVEKHAKKGKPLVARPNTWGRKKRESVYGICFEDLRNRKIDEYRCASDNSEAVYPIGAVLTPCKRL